MPSTITKTMPEILIDRMNTTRQEKRASWKAQGNAPMEQSMEKMLGSYGFSVIETAEGCAAIRKGMTQIGKRKPCYFIRHLMHSFKVKESRGVYRGAAFLRHDGLSAGACCPYAFRGIEEERA